MLALIPGGRPAQAEPAGADAAVALLQAPGHERAHRVQRHYLWSNERRHDLFFAAVRGLGQGYVGVGADQNYTLGAAASAQVLWLIDLDAAVVHLHHLYGAAMAAAPTPAGFLTLLSGRHEAALLDAARTGIPDEKVRRAALQVYADYGPLLYQRLRRTHRSRTPTWLSDERLYQHVRGLWQAGRIVPRLGDLNGPRTLRQIGDAAHAAGLAIRVIYLSNAESWFHYSQRLHSNLGALPLDDRSVVLRTVKSQLLRYPHGDVWHFSTQSAQDFLAKLATRRYRTVDHVMADLVHERGLQSEMPRGLSHIAPGVSPVRPRPAGGLVTRPAASEGIPPGDV
jgi:hypothetical protein